MYFKELVYEDGSYENGKSKIFRSDWQFRFLYYSSEAEFLPHQKNFSFALKASLIMFGNKLYFK